MLLQPVGQKRHTNVAVVRFEQRDPSTGDQFHFEIACYKNKVSDYLTGSEKNISEVLQSDKVYLSVSKGDLATNKDLKKCFGTTDQLKICERILREGETRATEKERKHEMENMQNEVVNIVSGMIMERETGLPIVSGRVEGILFHELKFRMKISGSGKNEAKVLAKEAVKMIEQSPVFGKHIVRVPVKVRLNIISTSTPTPTTTTTTNAADLLVKYKNEIYTQEAQDDWVILVCHPRLLKEFKDANIQVELIDSKVFMPLPKSSAPVVLTEASATEAGAVATDGAAASPKLKATAKASAQFNCKSCRGAEFGSMADLREHYKSAWHEHNKKRQVKNLAALDHLEYELLPDTVKKSFLAVD